MNLAILELIHILFKHKKLILATFLVVFGAVAIGITLRPDVYRAPGRLMITGQRSYFHLTPADSRQAPMEPDLRDINTEIENIKSAAFLNKVLATLPFSLLEREQGNAQDNEGVFARALALVGDGLQTIMSLPSTIGGAISSLFGAEESGPQASNGTGQPPNPALGVLRTALNVTAVPNSTLVEVAFLDKNPQRAATVVNAVLENYPNHQASLFQDPIALAFYDKQKEQLQKDVVELENQLRDYETREHVAAIGDQKKQVLSLLDKIKDRLAGTYLDIDQAHGKIARINQELPQLPATIVQGQELASPSTKLLEERLTTLEIERNELLQKYTEKDRRIQDKESEIAATKEKLLAAPRKVVVGERIGLNSVRVEMERELADQKMKLGQLVPKQVTLARQSEELTAELEALNVKEYEVERLRETYKNRKNLFDLYSKKAEEARISSAMDRENLVNVKVTDRAQIPVAPVPSNATLLLTLAAIIGLGAGIGGVLTLEYIRPTFHSEIDVERHLQLPVLALIPDLREEI